MDDAKLRAWWWHRQGLDGSLRGADAAAVLERAGWARSVGGSGPYLTFHARAGIGRTAAEAATERLEIHELPAARGCTYFVPAADFALALRVGQPFAGAPLKVAYKLGVSEREVERLCDAVLAALEGGPMDPDAIRQATGSASRSLGEEGKKKGVTTTLPLALGELQARGRIRRIPIDGRLDQQRYRYALWRPSPLDGYDVALDEANVELARRYFRWIGPATLAEFRWFTALGAKAAKSAVEPLGLVPAERDGERLMFEEDRERFAAFEPPAAPQYTLVSGIDSLVLLRRELLTLVDAADRERGAFVDRGERAIGGLADLPSNGIFDRGRLVGLWEFDPGEGTIAWNSFVPPDDALRAAVAETERYVRDELGDARSFSLDSPKSRAPRIASLRMAAAAAR